MLQPKRQKYRKQFRGKMRGQANSGNKVSFGDFGIKSLGRDWLTAQQIEAARKAITHYTKRAAKVWIRVFPDRPVTQKGLGVGMGHGKGDIKGYVVTIKPGKIIFEIGGVDAEIAREALRRAGHKLPFAIKIVSKEEQL